LNKPFLKKLHKYQRIYTKLASIKRQSKMGGCFPFCIFLDFLKVNF
jgi:hypothetical protein